MDRVGHAAVGQVSMIIGRMDASMAPKLSESQRVAVNALADQLKHTLGHRLHALVAYGRTAPDEFLHTLALADRVTFEDLTAIAPSIDRWRRAGLAEPEPRVHALSHAPGRQAASPRRKRS